MATPVSCVQPSVGLGEALARLVGLARGVEQLVFAVGDELRDGLDLLGREFLERGVGLDELAAVGGERGLRLLQAFLCVVKVDLGADGEIDRLLAGGDPVCQRPDQRFFKCDAHLQTLDRRVLLRHLLVEVVELVGELEEIGGQHRPLANAEGLRHRLVPRDALYRVGRDPFDRSARRASRRRARGRRRGCAGSNARSRFRRAGGRFPPNSHSLRRLARRHPPSLPPDRDRYSGSPALT